MLRLGWASGDSACSGPSCCFLRSASVGCDRSLILPDGRTACFGPSFRRRWSESRLESERPESRKVRRTSRWAPSIFRAALQLGVIRDKTSVGSDSQVNILL